MSMKAAKVTLRWRGFIIAGVCVGLPFLLALAACGWAVAGDAATIAAPASSSSAASSSAASNSINGNGSAGVLVELFTSEGCSSCPPADALLEKLDEVHPTSGAVVIVLSEHVDYWDHEGWKDTYSSHFFTERQEDYERRFGLKSAFTPQMVVDGAAQMNGSDGRAVAGAIETARSHAKTPVRISSVSFENLMTLRIHLDVEALPGDSKARRADVLVAVALDHAESHVSGGENKGRDIRHVAVAESISKVGTVEKGKNFDRDVLVKVKSPVDPANLRLIAFVQEPDGGEVVGASLLSAPLKINGPGIASARGTGAGEQTIRGQAIQ